MTVPIPGGLQQPAPGAFATLTDFNLTLKAGSSSKPFVALSGCPTGGLNVGGVFGTAGSHGCVRLSTKMMRWLARRMGPGTPVTITS